MFTSIVLLHVQNTANISDSFIKKMFLSFVDDAITFVCLYGVLQFTTNCS